ncbi:MAG: hypothetical protein FD123_2254 [Bacteroidetes bacterium]|nr:MAG: hypothetical protein FD123_2254 [Bacteroidota bacterium]
MKRLLPFTFFLLSVTAFAQPGINKAQLFYQKGLEQRSVGAIPEALRLFSQAAELDTGNFIYSYERGYTLALAGMYPAALEEMKNASRKTGANDTCFRMLGSLFSKTGDTASAMKALNNGLLKFPRSARLYAEKGILLIGENQPGRAADCFDRGIAAEPMYSINYYHAAKLSLASPEKHWGMVYGEIFLLIDTESDKRSEIRQMLYDTYVNSIKTVSPGKVELSFCVNAKDKNPFCKVYSGCLGSAVTPGSALNLATLAEIRTKFLGKYYTDKLNEKFPNPLFAHQEKMQKAGVLEAYHYWVLNVGEKERFIGWYDQHQEEFQKLLGWMALNPLKIDASTAFARKP